MTDDRRTMSEFVKLSFEEPHQRATPAKAREAVQQLLGDDAPIAMIRDAVLLTSELVTNALLHAPGGCGLEARFSRNPLWLRVDVSDSSARPPRLSETSVAALGGHGLRMVENLSSRWGWRPAGDGKSIWFELIDGATRDA
ncbi:MAG: ATP-binding protein [Actinomycetota bacterium]|nr:ATP-binding protein [Actinomycetota bacterium]